MFKLAPLWAGSSWALFYLGLNLVKYKLYDLGGCSPSDTHSIVTRGIQ